MPKTPARKRAAAKPKKAARPPRKKAALAVGKKTAPSARKKGVSPAVTDFMRERVVKELCATIEPLLDALADIAYFKDISGHYRIVNGAFLRLARRSRLGIIGRTDAEIFPIELAEKCRASDWKVMKHQKPVRVEESMAGGLGRIMFDTIKGPVIDKKIGLVGMIGISRDISKYHRTAEELKSVEERLSKVIAEAPIVLFAIDNHGTFTLSEGKGLAMLGLKPGEVVGRSAYEVYGGNQPILDSLRRALAGESFTLQVSEAGRVFDTHFTPQRLRDGRVSGMIGVAVDVTERVQAQRERESLLEKEKVLRAEAERSSRSKDDFLALLSHELRTPMTAMIGWTWLLRSKELGSADFSMALETIERNMKSQAQIIEDLLDISRFTSGKMRIEASSVELPNILRSAVDVVRPAADARQIQIDLDDDLPTLLVSGEGQRLQQALWNLLSNAVKFTTEGGKVRVQLRSYGESAEISIKDTGVGVSPDYLPHVFDPFSQAEDPMTREHRGLGLGLAIVKHIAEMHGGTVRVHSDGEGKGTEFMLSLPLLAAAERQTSEPVSTQKSKCDRLQRPDLSGIHVLIVEDEPDARTVLSASLRHCGARVTEACTAAEAFDSVRQDRPDVMISDLMMPGEDGFSLIRRVRDLSEEEGGDIPAATLTGRAGPEDRALALMNGFQMYILKPVEPVELAVVVKSLAKTKSA
ncbi:MAG: ATP-binding protein [Elusimicrobiota bacterium]